MLLPAGELARRAGCSRSSTWLAIVKHKPISPRMARGIARALGTSLESITASDVRSSGGQIDGSAGKLLVAVGARGARGSER